MTFYEYTTKKYIDADSPLGDFARDIQGDPFMRASKQKKFKILGHLYKEDACEEAIRAFETIWEEYTEVEDNV